MLEVHITKKGVFQYKGVKIPTPAKIRIEEWQKYPLTRLLECQNLEFEIEEVEPNIRDQKHRKRPPDGMALNLKLDMK